MDHEHLGADDHGRFDLALTIVEPDRRQALAGLFGLLAAGERLAHSVALLQSQLAPTRREARFFRTQARQEHLHAAVFELAQHRLAVASGRVDDPYHSFRQRVEQAASAGAYYESIVATQVILEHVGESLLCRLDAGIERRGGGLRRLRRLFLAQENAHHAFGRRVLREAIASGQCDPHWVARRAEPYLEQVPRWFERERALTETFGFDTHALVRAIGSELAALGQMREP